MSYTARSQYIIKKLIKEGGITLKEISNEFEISTRQAGRDIEALRYQLGAPIEYDRASKRYILTHSWSSYTNLDENMVILASYFKSLVSQLPLSKEIKKSVEEIFLSSLPLESKRLVDKIIYRPPFINFPNYNIFSQVTEALTSERQLKIEYTNFKKERSIRVVEPFRLINYENSWYLVAFDHKRESFINFHLSRISRSWLLDEKIKVKDSKLTIDDSFGIYINGKKRWYTISFSDKLTADVSSNIFHKEQIIEKHEDGSFLLHIPATNPQELITLVLTYAPYAHPLSPDDFVSAYKERVKAISSSI